MNLSDETIKFLGQKARLAALEEAINICYDVAEELEDEEASGAHSVRVRLENVAEKLSIELGIQEE